MNNNNVRWGVRVKFDTSRIVRLTGVRETAKRFYFDSYENILGYTYLGKFVSKDGETMWFDDAISAIKYLIVRFDAHIERHQVDIRNIEREQEKLKALLSEL